jgi:hypothetical protein
MGLLMTFNLDKEAFVKELVEVAKLDKKCAAGRSLRRVDRLARLTRADARGRARYAQEAADALYEKAMQFCSNELPVWRRKRPKREHLFPAAAAPDGPAPRALPPPRSPRWRRTPGRPVRWPRS